MRKANSRCRQREVERRQRFWVKNYQDRSWYLVEGSGKVAPKVIKKGKGF